MATGLPFGVVSPLLFIIFTVCFIVYFPVSINSHQSQHNSNQLPLLSGSISFSPLSISLQFLYPIGARPGLQHISAFEFIPLLTSSDKSFEYLVAISNSPQRWFELSFAKLPKQVIICRPLF